MINCDLAETSFENDKALMPYIDMANICCGAHAGSLELSEKVIDAATVHNIKVGAHPSYPDKENFGRQSMDIDVATLMTSLKDQINSIQKILLEYKGKLNHIKPHGALYHDLSTKPVLANAFVKMIQNHFSNIPVMAMHKSELSSQLKKQGIKVIEEIFGDRRYIDLTQLVSRSENNAVINDIDSFKKQWEDITNGYIKSVSSVTMAHHADTVCLHGDSPLVIDFLKSLHGHDQ